MPTDEMNIDNNEFRPFSHLGRATQHPSSEFRTPNTSAPSSDTESDNRPFYAENSQNTQERMTQKYMIPLYPLTLAASQMLILRYLTPMGEYQEFLPYIFEHNAMDIIFNFIDKVDPKNTCLAFEALKYLASLLCHKKFSVEFLSRNGLQVS
jgi:HIV-1 Vpr-binding protein